MVFTLIIPDLTDGTHAEPTAADFVKAQEDMIKQLDPAVKGDQKTKDLEAALAEYARKVAAGELTNEEAKKQYLQQNVQSLASKVLALTN